MRNLCLHAGADDVGFISINRNELDDQRKEILNLFPGAKTLISFVCKMNREPLRSTARSIANKEFHHVVDDVTHIGHEIVKELEKQGIKALNPPAGFPMEQESTGKTWVISHKPIAVAAGLGQIGIHRNVIHPKFGNFILLGTILTNAEMTSESQPIDYNPCLECKLCVAACPVGAIGADGHFNFSACYTHNYREFSGGFTDWVEKIIDSKNSKAYRDKVNDT
ncbi:4Fe-4S binding protein, partial [Priestia megaterium]